MTGQRFRMGCDIGGTFTDFVLLDTTTGEMRLEKCLTTPADPSEAVLDGVRLLGKGAPRFLDDTSQVFHGTTLVINAVIERKGAKTALITTAGFRDVLEIGTERRYDVYDLQQQYPVPLVPRNLRHGITERIWSDGRVMAPLDEEELARVIERFVDERVESLAVCLLHSYRNPVHEQRIAAYVQHAAPHIAISISSDVLPEIKEYERTATTVVNAYVKPVMQGYAGRLSDRLAASGFTGQLLIMLSSGGVTSVETAMQYPVRVIESGPVAGVIMSQHIAKLANVPDVLSFDMGGTTAKACLLQNGMPTRAREFEVARVHRFKKGSGIPVHVPVLDLLEIGAGGGSIAHINALGLLQVGPESAGADPGPACYGRRGSQPTVTDADLVLGYLNPDYFLGGTMRLDVEASRAVIQERLAAKLGIDPLLAAWGIHDLVNENMAAAAKMHLAEKGGDPSTLALVAFGGAGPVHCYSLAKKLGVRRVIVPVAAGVASAVGFLTAPVSYDVVRTHKIALADADVAGIEKIYRAMEEEALAVLRKGGEAGEATFNRSADIRYIGQGYEINVAFPARGSGVPDRQGLLAIFTEGYRRFYGRTFPENEFEIVNLRVVVEGPPPTTLLQRRRSRADGTPRKGTRAAYLGPEHEFVEHAVYDRYRLVPGDIVHGPAIVEERESTTCIGRDALLTVDEYGMLDIRFEALT